MTPAPPLGQLGVSRNPSSTAWPANGWPESSPPTSPVREAATWSKAEAVLAARSGRHASIPASAQKLFVATAALDTLGPDFTYETKGLAPAASRKRRRRSTLPRRRRPVPRHRRTTSVDRRTWSTQNDRVHSPRSARRTSLPAAFTASLGWWVTIRGSTRNAKERLVAGLPERATSDRCAHRERRLSHVRPPAHRRSGRARGRQAHGPSRRGGPGGPRPVVASHRTEREIAKVASPPCTRSSVRC